MSGGAVWSSSSPTTIGGEDELVGVGNNERINMAYTVIEALEAIR